MGKDTKIAYAVAVALGTIAGAAHAATPSVTQCKSPNNILYVAGSSAAQNAFGNALNTDLLGGGAITFSASNGNFKAYCGISANAAVVPVGNVVVVHYRAEGGSVVGALPIAGSATGAPPLGATTIKFLDLTNAAVTTTAVATTGTSAANGITDSWGGPLTGHTVEVGVTDVEPGQFIGKNYPSTYNTANFGTATPANLGALTKTVLFDQVFGLFVNTSGLSGGGTGQTINLTRSTVANILTGLYTDWSQVPTGTAGTAVVSSTPAAITLVNREPGSGTRTGASIYFLGYNCDQSATPIAETGAADGFATADVLATATATPGSITYASIDNAGKANLSTVQLNGVAPSNAAVISGSYDWWYEAQLIKGVSINSTGSAIYTFLTTELSNVNTAPHVVDILAVPKAFAPGVPAANTAEPGAPIYVNPFTRLNNSCHYPAQL
jgi:hypothetical protein